MAIFRGRCAQRVLVMLGMLVGLGPSCETASTTPGMNPAVLGLCSYPRACYLVRRANPLQGQCESCTNGATCRLLYQTDDNGGAGRFTTSSSLPSPTDTPAVCGTYTPASPDLVPVCATPETVCVARGPDCPLSGVCVPEGKDCSSSQASFPQRRPGTAQTACPFEKSRCCAPNPDAGSGDGGATDMSSGDAGLSI